MGSQSDAVILLYIISFYVVIIFFMGLIGSFQVSKTITAPNGEDLGFDAFDYIAFFFEGIGFSIESLGIFNFVLFAPLGLTLLYLLAKLLRGGG